MSPAIPKDDSRATPAGQPSNPRSLNQQPTGTTGGRFFPERSPHGLLDDAKRASVIVVDEDQDDVAARDEPTVAGPSGEVVILRESELDTDLATAIRRVRENDATRLSRILIVAPDRGESSMQSRLEESLEVDPRPLAEPTMPLDPRQLVRLAEPELLQPIGARLESLVGCLELFAEETRTVIAELGDGAAEVPRARIAGSVRRVREILDWATVTRAELRVEAERAFAGERRCEIAELARDAARALVAHFPRMRLQVADDESGSAMVVARAAELTEAIFGLLLVAAHRVGGEGPLDVSVALDPSEVRLCIAGFGEPRQVDLADRIREVRAIVARCGGHIVPTGQGAGGTGVELRLPRA